MYSQTFLLVEWCGTMGSSALRSINSDFGYIHTATDETFDNSCTDSGESIPEILSEQDFLDIITGLQLDLSAQSKLVISALLYPNVFVHLYIFLLFSKSNSVLKISLTGEYKIWLNLRMITGEICMDAACDVTDLTWMDSETNFTFAALQVKKLSIRIPKWQKNYKMTARHLLLCFYFFFLLNS